jgi:rhodanese-related sulfurtransferase/DNA-binding transcriptional ArsR family regulator
MEIIVDPALRLVALSHYEELARLGKAVSSPVRLQLLDLLRQGPKSVEVLSSHAGVPVANTSQHLQQLRAAHLVTSERQGQRTVYRLSNQDVSRFFVCLRQLGEGLLPELDRLKQALQGQDEPEREALLARIARGEAILLDVRADDEFAANHLPGAFHIPLPELAARVDELPKDTSVVAYCRGPYCPMAITAVEILHDAGFDATHLDLGPSDIDDAASPTTTLAKQTSPRSA